MIARNWARFAGVLAMLAGLLGLLGAAQPAAGQSGDSSITVHNRICPVEYEGNNYFGDCHGTVPDPGLPFTFVNEDTGEALNDVTNAEGNVGFANLSEGTWTITGGAPGEFAERVVYCAVGTAETSDQSPVDFQYVQGGIQFFLPADTNVICDWYEVPFNLQGETPTEAPQPEQFDLPIFALSCVDDPGSQAASDFVMMGEVPVGCERYGGASVTIATPEGSAYGSCETGASEPCFVTVPAGATVLATIDPATLPADTTVLGSQTQEIQIPPASEAWVLFIAVPAVQTPTPVPPTPTPLPPTPTPVPVEGRDVAIHEGGCDAAPGTPVVELTDLTGPEIGPDANADVIVAETSSSTIDLSLDTLTGDEHALVVFSDEDDATPVACTPIDGERNAIGELVLGLQEVEESGYAGIVYLAPAGDDGQTRISVFLGEGLADDAETDALPTPTPIG